MMRNLHGTMAPSAIPRLMLTRIAAVLGACALLALSVSCSRPKEPTIPTEAKARSDLVGAAQAKLGPDEHRLLARFVARQYDLLAGLAGEGNDVVLAASPGVLAARLVQEKRRVPPYFWAAFVLSGDWR